MKSTIRHGLPLLRFPGLADCPGLDHGIFTRQGGVSSPPFDSLNLGTAGGDRPEDVRQNRAAVTRCFNHDRLIFVKQVHGTGIRVFKKERTPDLNSADYLEGDALVSDIPGLLLGIKLADCQAVILFDPVKLVAANIHSGWRGSVANIIGKTIGVMKEEFGSQPGDIQAGISPSLGPCCAEFVNYQQELPPELWSYKAPADSPDNSPDNHPEHPSEHHFDFWAISRDQLTTAGVPEDHIETAGICTRCRTDLFFSYRAEGRTGRFVAVAGLTPDNS